MITVLQNLLPVNEHMDDTRGKLLGVRKRRVILNLRGVKDDQIGIIPGSQGAAFFDPEIGCGQRRQTPNRLLK